MENLIEDIKVRISILLQRIEDVPEYLKPKVNISNDLAYPFIDVGFDGSLYYVVRERGVEVERIMFYSVDSLLFKIFKDLTFELAMKKEIELRHGDEQYSIDKIYQIQDELMKRLNPSWCNGY